MFSRSFVTEKFAVAASRFFPSYCDRMTSAEAGALC